MFVFVKFSAGKHLSTTGKQSVIEYVFSINAWVEASFDRVL